MSGVMSRTAQAASCWHFTVEVMIGVGGNLRRGWVTQIGMPFITKKRCQSLYRGHLCMSVSYKEVNQSIALLCSFFPYLYRYSGNLISESQPVLLAISRAVCEVFDLGPSVEYGIC